MKYFVFLGGFVRCGVIVDRCGVVVDRFGVFVDCYGSFRVLVTTEKKFPLPKTAMSIVRARSMLT